MSTDVSRSRISGSALPASQFRLRESTTEFDIDLALEVLRGHLAAYRVQNFVSATDCAAITRNFWASPARVPRVGEGADGVEAYILGASHIEMSTASYLQAVAASAPAVASLFDRVADPMATLRQRIADRIGAGRPAEHDEGVATGVKAVCWNNNTGEYLLLPHDDLAQLSDPQQADFEIQRVRQVMAVNVYPHVPGASGQLRLWNVAPDEATRARLGVMYSGYPYPPTLLADHPSLTIPVMTGDLCLINGNLVHAVLGGGTEAERGRLLLTCFSGMVGDEFLWWT